MTVKKTTESDSLHDDLEQKSVAELILLMNQEDRKVPEAIHKVLPEIENVINRVVKALNNGGRLFYIGAGTSGRLGILDASECPPTFGVSHELVIGLIGITGINTHSVFAQAISSVTVIQKLALSSGSTTAFLSSLGMT